MGQDEKQGISKAPTQQPSSQCAGRKTPLNLVWYLLSGRICWIPEVLFTPTLPMCDSELQVRWGKGRIGKWLLVGTIQRERESPHTLLMDLLTSLREDRRCTEIIVLVTGSCNWELWLRCLESDSLGLHHLLLFLMGRVGWYINTVMTGKERTNRPENHRGPCKVKPFFPRRLR